jgi:hypothetical protein
MLSAASEPIDRGYKMELYARGGSSSYWIIDVTRAIVGKVGRWRRADLAGNKLA